LIVSHRPAVMCPPQVSHTSRRCRLLLARPTGHPHRLAHTSSEAFVR
jgi:hypothetical protein